MKALAAHYFDGRESRARVVLVSWNARELLLEEAGVRRVFSLAAVRVSDRLGSAPRRVYLGDGGELSLDDHAAGDALAAQLRQGWVARGVFALEQRYLVALLALGVALLGAWAGVRHAVPWLAARAVQIVPPEMEARFGEEAFSLLEQAYLGASRLPQARQAELAARMAGVCGRTQVCPAYRLFFRQGGEIGANALALPGGWVIVTDELVALAANDEALVGVILHELGHVQGRHALRLGLSAAGAVLIGQVLVGDLGSLGDVASLLPTLLTQSAYSRDMESEADVFAATAMRRACLSPESLAHMLERLGRHAGGKMAVPEWLSSHPGPSARAAALRALSVPPGCEAGAR